VAAGRLDSHLMPVEQIFVSGSANAKAAGAGTSAVAGRPSASTGMLRSAADLL